MNEVLKHCFNKSCTCNVLMAAREMNDNEINSNQEWTNINSFLFLFESLCGSEILVCDLVILFLIF